jgi:hypothetical protein
VITLDQWKSIRRVDHLTVPVFSFRRGFYKVHPRYRDPANRPDLKHFDRYIQRFHSVKDDFDRVNHLASIIRRSANFIAGRNKNDRYDKAVNTLHNEALTAMNQICGHAHQQEMENYITNTARPGRTIKINVLIVTKPGETVPVLLPRKIVDHIVEANFCRAYKKAGLKLDLATRTYTHLTNYGGGPILCPHPPAPQYMDGKFLETSNESGGRLINYCNSLGNNNGARTIDVAYIPDFVDKDTGGLTFRAGVKWGGATPLRPIVIINANPSQAMRDRGGIDTTLAHELGHAICGCGLHAEAANNLMAGGNDRDGSNRANPGQCAWFCSNDWVT